MAIVASGGIEIEGVEGPGPGVIAEGVAGVAAVTGVTVMDAGK